MHSSRTAVVASTHRVYTTREKMAGGDGRFDPARIVDAVQKLSRHCTLFDMEAVRSRHGAAISAVLFGALAGSGALPLARQGCEQAIRDAGKGVTASLAAFAEAFACAERSQGAAGSHGLRSASRGRPGAPSSAGRDAAAGTALAARIDALPGSVAEIVRSGAAQVAAYQDIAYAERYVERVERICAPRGLPVAVQRRTVVVARRRGFWRCGCVTTT